MERTAEAYLTLAEELNLAWLHIQSQHRRNRDMTDRIERAGTADEHEWAAMSSMCQIKA